MIKLDQIEKRLRSLINYAWDVEFKSGGKQRVRTVPMIALVATHRLVDTVAKRVKGKR